MGTSCTIAIMQIWKKLYFALALIAALFLAVSLVSL